MAKYKFKGYTITNCGYHQPDHCVWWEAVDENGAACFHGNTLREVEFMILDYEWEQKMRKKEEEIEVLKASKPSGNAAAMLEALKNLVDSTSEYIKECNPSIAGGCEIRRALENAKDALAKPPRNCDVGTPEERMCRYNRLREEINERYKRLGEIPPPFAFPTAFEWEDRPYEEGGADE